MNPNAQRSLHPFFDRDIAGPALRDTETHKPTEVSDDEPDTKTEASKAAGKRRKPKAKENKQRTLKEVVKPHSNETHSEETNSQRSPEPDLNEGRRKRRRTCPVGSVDVGASENTPADSAIALETTHDAETQQQYPNVVIPVAQHVNEKSTQAATSDPSTPPKKILRLGVNGKFNSPPARAVKKAKEDHDQQTPNRRGRQRKSRQQKPGTGSSLIAKIPYGTNEASRAAMGNQISAILSSETKPATGKAGPKKRSPKKLPKATHPFFLEKPKSKEVPSEVIHESPRKTSAVTPGKLRMKTAIERSHDSNEASSTFVSELLKDRLVPRIPGAKEAAFPYNGQLHVRDVGMSQSLEPMQIATFNMALSARKHKRARLPFPYSDSIVANFSAQMKPTEESVHRSDGFLDPHPSLRLPERLLLSGQEILERIKLELSTDLAEIEDELNQGQPFVSQHPALRHLDTRIATTLTAFDEVRGEPLMWTQKYAPTSADETLQPVREVSVLRDWLKSLKVTAVGNVPATGDKRKTVNAIEKPKKKRRKKHDMDDFIVGSDEEEAPNMNDINDDNNEGSDPELGRTVQKSIIETVHDGGKLSNAILLSGPNGCGKTAAAYAVAKELGFKVFEISASERRSGKDILDKVGNMTENHLVKHHGTDTDTDVSSAEAPSQVDEALQRDLQSGKQGRLNAFFKPHVQIKTEKKKTSPKIDQKKASAAVREAIAKPPKDQQQSLILLEEVDILFKDDKEFWSTVLKLVVTSKRPCIMTCNDEDLVPLQAMSLHAILRFSKPPVELATDYLLLLAAAEGHLLQREPVAFLYQSKHCDLRASITELQYWCQMGIGDPRGGLGWIYQRWPPGSDVDEKGRKLRVASSETYQHGMGIIPTKTTDSELLLSWAWDQFGIDPLTAFASIDEKSSEHRDDFRNDRDRRRALVKASSCADALSAADACCQFSLADPPVLDPTQPALSENTRSHYIGSLALLQTDEHENRPGMSQDLLVTLATSSYRVYKPSTLDQITPFPFDSGHPPSNDYLTRHSMSCFDPISTSSDPSTGMTQSVFDSPLSTLSVDLAPYVRSIVQYDQALEEQRLRLDQLMSDGRASKRARTTRAARSAIEGGQRATTRRQRWFSRDLDMRAVLATGGSDWPRGTGEIFGAPASRDGTEDTEAPVSSAEM